MKQTKQQEENCILSMHSYVKNVLFTFVKQTENLQTQLTWDSAHGFLNKGPLVLNVIEVGKCFLFPIFPLSLD